jgi:hypothetical protein
MLPLNEWELSRVNRELSRELGEDALRARAGAATVGGFQLTSSASEPGPVRVPP